MFVKKFVGNKWFFDLEIFRKVFTEHSVGIESDCNWMQGNLLIEIEQGFSIGPFNLKVKFTDKYYQGLESPEIFLMSHRNQYENTGDYHIEKNWKLCPYIDFESKIDFTRIDAFKYILERLGVFLHQQNQYHQEVLEKGKELAQWPGKERLHGIEGIIQACLSNIKKVSDPCPCGSLRPFIECHGQLIDKQFMEISNAR